MMRQPLGWKSIQTLPVCLLSCVDRLSDKFFKISFKNLIIDSHVLAYI